MKITWFHCVSLCYKKTCTKFEQVKLEVSKLFGAVSAGFFVFSG